MIKIREISELIRVLSCSLKKHFVRGSSPYFIFGIQKSKIRKGLSDELCIQNVSVQCSLVVKLHFGNQS